jgi:hypothetical protein
MSKVRTFIAIISIFIAIIIGGFFFMGSISQNDALLYATFELLFLNGVYLLLPEQTEKIIAGIKGIIKHDEIQSSPPKADEKPNVLVESGKASSPVSLAVSAIFINNKSNPTTTLFCYSKRQKRYILPGGHFWENSSNPNEKIEAWKKNPKITPYKFLLNKKLNEKYGIQAILDEKFHAQQQDIRDAIKEPLPYCILHERPEHDEGHEYHYDFYYMCNHVSTVDKNKFNEYNCKWLSLEEINKMVDALPQETFANLLGVITNAIKDKEEKSERDK